MHEGDAFGLVGQIVDTQFRVVGVAGQGASSIVYRAEHISSQRPIALKVLRLSPHDNQTSRQRFWESCHALDALSSYAGACRLLASGATVSRSQRPLLYMAFAWLEGTSLANDSIARLRGNLPPRSWGEIHGLFESAATALAHAHHNNIVHRDIKPSNLFVLSTGPIVILDFGVATILTDELASDAPTRVLDPSPRHAAPEVFDRGSGLIGPWTDVYSFALVMLEVAQGRAVRRGSTYAELAMEVMDKRVPSPRALGMSVPDLLEDVFVTALAFDPQKRTRDVGELWSRFRAALGIGDRLSQQHTRIVDGPAPDSLTTDMPDASHLSSSVRQFLGKVREPMPTPTQAFDDERTIAVAPPQPSSKLDREPSSTLKRPMLEPSTLQVTESQVLEDPIDRTIKLADNPAAHASMLAITPQSQSIGKGSTLALSGPHVPPLPVAQPPVPIPTGQPSTLGQVSTLALTGPQAAPLVHGSDHGQMPPMRSQQPTVPAQHEARPVPSSSGRTMLWIMIVILALGVVGTGAMTIILMQGR